jgi:hypothetical protein
MYYRCEPEQTRTQNLHPWITFIASPTLVDGEEVDLQRSFIARNAHDFDCE